MSNIYVLNFNANNNLCQTKYNIKYACNVILVLATSGSVFHGQRKIPEILNFKTTETKDHDLNNEKFLIVKTMVLIKLIFSELSCGVRSSLLYYCWKVGA